MGGERLTDEMAEFPRHGKRLLRAGDRAEIVDEAAIRSFWPQT